MRLLLCAAAYPPSVGGVQTLSARIAGSMARRGHRVRVLARGRGGDSDIDDLSAQEQMPFKVTRISNINDPIGEEGPFRITKNIQ